MAVENENTAPVNSNFIRTLIEEDIEKGATVPRKWCGHPAPYSEQVKGVDDPARIRTRFPPEPNGYLHIGHAKSICINFGMARDFGGYAHMRFDDTNPGKESPEYVESIKETVKWLGFSWEHNGENDLFFASSYFKWMYQFAEYLIRTGYAYVDEQTQDEMRANRGTLTEPGKDSPFRNRSVEENLRVFREMRDGKHPEGSMVLRAKIDMASPNVNLRDPAIYRIRFAEHQETGNEWCIYPMYTFAHPIEDSLENITHSLCTLEFEDQRPFYDWALERIVPELRTPQYEEAKQILKDMAEGRDDRADAFLARVEESKAKLGITSDPEVAMAEILARHGAESPLAADAADRKAAFALLNDHTENFTPVLQAALDVVRPNFFMLSHQHEFNRLNITNVVLSKRKLITLVKEGLVDGWDDPRLVSISGLRRRGYTPESIQKFVELCGVSKADSSVDYAMLEYCIREDLKLKAPRYMAVLDPIKLIIDNYPEGQVEYLDAPNNMENEALGSRKVPFGKELYIEREDFMIDPPKKYKRLFLGTEVRLMNAYFVTCTGFEALDDGTVTAVHCTYDPETKGGNAPDGRKVKGTIHWVEASNAGKVPVRLYENIVDEEKGVYDKETGELNLNPNSLIEMSAYVEPELLKAKGLDSYQFVRNGFYCADIHDSKEGAPVFNRIVSLKSSFKLPKA